MLCLVGLPLRQAHAQLTQDAHQLFLQFGRMMHLMDCHIANICLHLYCTKSQQRFLQTRHFVVNRLNLIQRNIGHCPMEQPFLRNLNKSLICDYKNTEIPTEVAGSKHNGRQHKTGYETAIKSTH